MQTGGGLSHHTIQKMKQRGAPQSDIDFAIETQTSFDPSNVAIHRKYINDYNRSDVYRETNNFVMHPLDYRFGPGLRSPYSIGSHLGQHGAVVYMGPTPVSIHPALAPHVYFSSHPF